jgi:hypothetical protein
MAKKTEKNPKGLSAKALKNLSIILKNGPPDDFDNLTELMLINSDIRDNNFYYAGENFNDEKVNLKNSLLRTKWYEKIIDSGIPLTREFVSKAFFYTKNPRIKKIIKTDYLGETLIMTQDDYIGDFESQISKLNADVEEDSGEEELPRPKSILLADEKTLEEIQKYEDEVLYPVGKRSYATYEGQDNWPKFVNSVDLETEIIRKAFELHKLQAEFEALEDPSADYNEIRQSIEDIKYLETEKIKLEKINLKKKLKAESDSIPTGLSRKAQGIIKDTSLNREETFQALHDAGLNPVLFEESINSSKPVGFVPTLREVVVEPPPTDVTDPEIEPEPSIETEQIIPDPVQVAVVPDNEYQPKYHLKAINNMYGTTKNVPWDLNLQKTMIANEYTAEEINEGVDALISQYSNKLLIFKRKSDGDFIELLELQQLGYSVERFMSIGNRGSKSIVDTEEINAFSNLLNGQQEQGQQETTEPTSAEDLQTALSNTTNASIVPNVKLIPENTTEKVYYEAILKQTKNDLLSNKTSKIKFSRDYEE